jgi:hypothetical protein
MSRQIDITKPLSDEDRQYLEDRARHEDLRRNAEIVGEREADVLTPINDGNTGDVDPFKADDGTEQITGTNPGERTVTAAQAADTGVPTADDADDAGDEPDDDYDDEDEWSFRDLQAEIKDRNEGRDEADKISAQGSRPELIARLREDDAASE